MTLRMLAVAGWFCASFQTTLALAQQDVWMLMSHESGCGPLQILVRMERLLRAPSSPEEFAEMMRARNHTVSVGLPEGFPPELTGKAVMVKYAENRAPVFLRAELCGVRKGSDPQAPGSAGVPRPR